MAESVKGVDAGIRPAIYYYRVCQKKRPPIIGYHNYGKNALIKTRFAQYVILYVFVCFLQSRFIRRTFKCTILTFSEEINLYYSTAS